MLRLKGTSAWADMTPAFAYHGNKLTWTMLADGREMKYEPQIEERDQLAREMDHFSDCILQNRQPHPPGEEGWQDQRIMEWIYEGVDL